MTQRWMLSGWAALVVATAQLAAQTQTVGQMRVDPASVPAGAARQVLVTIEVDDPTSVVPDGVNVQQVDSAGRVLAVLGSLRNDGRDGDAIANDAVYSGRVTVLQAEPGTMSLRVSAGFRGSLRRVFSAPVAVEIAGVVPATVRIQAPVNLSYVNISPVVVTGVTGDPAAQVTVNGIRATKNGTAFSAAVPLIEGTNTLAAVAQNANGSTLTSSVQVTLDTTPPRVTIDSPVNSYTTTEASIAVTGIVNDIVVGTVNEQQAQVTVNGVMAQVNNRTFAAATVPLQMGLNTIQAIGRDRAGNNFTASIQVTRQAIPQQPRLAIVSGNNQTGAVGGPLASPLVVQAVDAAGRAAAGVPVTFRVAENNGLVNDLPAVVVATDAQGRAEVRYKLGGRSGAGNNTVIAEGSGYVGQPAFTASGTATVASRIVVDSGLNQTGALTQALPFPFIAIVTDAQHNRLRGVPVTFTVKQGGGKINGLTAYSTTSDSDGRALAILTLGVEEGQNNNIVEATIPGNTGLPAAFTATALAAGEAQNTLITGVVLDNSNRPIPGVAIRMYRLAQGANNVQPQQISTPVQTDAKGHFRIERAPVGVMKLMADGSTAQPTGGWPTLEYDLVTVAGRENTVGSPIYLQALDRVNRLCVDETTGGTLTLPNAPGFSLTVAAGSASFPGGSRRGCISVTPVNPDKVPMAPGFGQQPRFVVTIQPVGTVFNPPAAITIPNLDGLAPRVKTEMYSYDHDLASFVAIGTGSVSEDGSVIASDTGVGVIKAGWHCGGNPNPTGSAGTCPTCQKCQGSGCVPTTGACNDSNVCTQNDRCANGSCTGDPVDTSQWTDDTSLQADVKIPPDLLGKVNRIFQYIPGLNGVKFKEVRVGISGRAKDCCNPQSGVQRLGLKEGSGIFQLTAEVANIPIWGSPTISRAFDFSVVVVDVDFQVGLLFSTNFRINGQAGVRRDACNPGNNCVFGEVNGSLDPEIKTTFEAIACLDTIWTTKRCGGLTITPLSVRMNIGAGLRYNKPACNSGLEGTAFLGRVTLRAEFSLDIPAAPQRIVFQYDLFGGVAQL